jgi:hypothetical protein
MMEVADACRYSSINLTIDIDYSIAHNLLAKILWEATPITTHLLFPGVCLAHGAKSIL